MKSKVKSEKPYNSKQRKLLRIEIVPTLEMDKKIYFRTVIYDVEMNLKGKTTSTVRDIYLTNTISQAVDALHSLGLGKRARHKI